MPCPLISFIKCSFLSYVSKQKIAVIQEAEAGDEIATYDDDPIGLLPDTEFTENIPENFIGGDFAGDFAQMMEGSMNIDGYQVCGDVVIEAFFHRFNGFKRFL
jgi:hypothetical protein